MGLILALWHLPCVDALLQDSFLRSISTQIMSDTLKKLADFQHVVVHGRIAHMEIVSYQGDDFLSVTLAHTISENADVRVKFTNGNGLLTAFRNGTVVIGQELTVSGNIKGIRAFYLKDDDSVPLRYPEIQLRCQGYIFGSKPMAKGVDAVPFATEPTLEELPF